MQYRRTPPRPNDGSSHAQTIDKSLDDAHEDNDTDELVALGPSQSSHGSRIQALADNTAIAQSRRPADQLPRGKKRPEPEPKTPTQCKRQRYAQISTPLTVNEEP